MSARTRKILILTGQCLVSVALLVWLLHGASVRAQLAAAFRGGDWLWVAIGVAFGGLGILLGLLRWRIFLHALGERVGVRRAAHIYLIGVTFDQVLVGSVGGDAVRAGLLVAEGRSKHASFLSVMLDRMSGFGALALVVALCTLRRYDWLASSRTALACTWFVTALLGAMALLIAGTTLLSVLRCAARLPPRCPGRERMIEFMDLFSVFARNWRATLLATVISGGILLSYFFTFYCAARAFGVPLAIGDLYTIMPLIDVGAALPLSLGGVGVREALFQVLLGDLLGTPPAAALLVSLGGFGMTACWALPGLLLVPAYRRQCESKVAVA